jgi:hypothetical protein
VLCSPHHCLIPRGTEQNNNSLGVLIQLPNPMWRWGSQNRWESFLLTLSIAGCFLMLRMRVARMQFVCYLEEIDKGELESESGLS